MKSLIKIALAFTFLVMVFSCESGEDTEPMTQRSFAESELLELVEPVVAGLSTSRYQRGHKSTSTVYDLFNAEVGKSLLIRSPKSVAMALKSYQEPSHTATIWWIIWNNPENCVVPGSCGADEDFANLEAVGFDILFATGSIVNDKGVGSFAASLKEGDFSNSVLEDFFGLQPTGLIDAEKAEIHLVVRSHGPQIPGQVEDQISSYAGGCTVFFDPFTEIPDAPGECGDIQGSIHAVD